MALGISPERFSLMLNLSNKRGSSATMANVALALQNNIRKSMVIKPSKAAKDPLKFIDEVLEFNGEKWKTSSNNLEKY